MYMKTAKRERLSATYIPDPKALLKLIAYHNYSIKEPARVLSLLRSISALPVTKAEIRLHSLRPSLETATASSSSAPSNL